MAPLDLSPTFDPWTAIPAQEFRDRQRRLREATAAAGFAGAVVFSRGGAFLDQFQDALYLTNHYSQQPAMGDETGIGSARSHAAVVVPVDGPSSVVVDVPWWRRDLVVADRVIPSIDVAGSAAAALREAGLADGAPVALVGASYMTAAAYLGLRAAVPDADLRRADRLVERLRIHKSPAEIDLVRRACALGSRAMDAMMAAVVPGATETDAVAAAAAVLIAGGGALYDAACASGPTSHGFTHGRIPSADPVRRMRAGDLFHVDFYGAYGGYYFDFARSRAVGDDPSPEQRDLLEATIEAVDHICAAIRPGMTAAELYAVGDAWARESPVVASLPVEEPEMEGFPAYGHGIGLMWEGPWITPDDDMALEPGMCLGIELLLGHPSRGGAMFEENLVVTDTGAEIITDARRRWW
jgi:Xaa-Pro aminopeptidase